ncbi:mitochondrial signal processing peptidase [Klebsormidium nitens]|uniref:signal peptidase I n=1 Tax=Klebsormidium nitens TaxID=105231 RepID=A0A1Y1HT40_KLENI|nr:mitochondrial signal processing peptidase [Klebsormidium nitens]|eukprot:GAQ80171.1 mitochondrial signal processing peptidase [Klebsormidium nitens]
MVERGALRHHCHAASLRARVTCSAQRDKKSRGWWLGKRLFSSPEMKKGNLPWTSLTREELDSNERPQWVPQWVPDSPPEWLESSLKQLERASKVAAALTLALGTAAVLRVLVFNPSCVPSGSMVPTLLPGDCVFVEIGTYRFLRRPARGDIVVFRPPSSFNSATMREEGDLDEGSPLDSAMTDAPGAQYVKRVVAVGGDTVQVERGVVLVNGRPRSEEARGIRSAKYSVPQLRVPDGTLFVLGDNRNRSADSHVWGFLPEDRVVGRSWLRWKPLSRIGVLK